MTNGYGQFFSLLTNELTRAIDIHEPMNSLHEGYAVILEEVDEFKAEVWKKPHKRDRAEVLQELVQIAAMCARTAIDCALMEEPDVEVPRSEAVPTVKCSYKLGLFMDAT